MKKIIFICFIILFFNNFIYDNSVEINKFIKLIDINEKWAKFYYYKYNLNEVNITQDDIINIGLAIMKWESNCNSEQMVWEKKVSGYSYGQYGILSTTAKDMGWKGMDLLNPDTNAKYALKYYCIKIKKYKDIQKALAAYNGGMCRYNKNGKIRNRYYVNNVYNLYEELSKYGKTK